MQFMPLLRMEKKKEGGSGVALVSGGSVCFYGVEMSGMVSSVHVCPVAVDVVDDLLDEVPLRCLCPRLGNLVQQLLCLIDTVG